MSCLRLPAARARLTLLAAALAGCAVAPTATREPAPECQFPPGVALSFAGETTLGEIGLAAPGGESLRAYAWTTATPIDVPGDGPPKRAVCAELGDGTFMVSEFPVPLRANDGG